MNFAQSRKQPYSLLVQIYFSYASTISDSFPFTIFSQIKTLIKIAIMTPNSPSPITKAIRDKFANSSSIDKDLSNKVSSPSSNLIVLDENIFLLS